MTVETDILMPLPGTPQMSVKKWKQVQAPVQPTPGNQRSGSIAPRQWARALREELEDAPQRLTTRVAGATRAV